MVWFVQLDLSSMRSLSCRLILAVSSVLAGAQVDPYPHNAVTCERCHNVPSKFGGSSMTVKRVGSLSMGKFAPATEGGIHHRHGESAESSDSASQISGERVSLNLLGDGHIEATLLVAAHGEVRPVRQLVVWESGPVLTEGKGRRS